MRNFKRKKCMKRSTRKLIKFWIKDEWKYRDRRSYDREYRQEAYEDF